MAWQASGKTDLTVRRHGYLLPPAPSQAAAVLLCGLLHFPHDWHSRAEIASRLYAKSGREEGLAAVRQTVRRLRQWLGDGAILAGKTHLKASEEWDLSDFVLPRLEHEWLDELRSAGHPTGTSPVPIQEYVTLVREAAEYDLNDATELAFAGQNLLWELAPEGVRQLLKVIRGDRSQGCHPLYLELRSEYQHRMCRFDEAIGTLFAARTTAAPSSVSRLEARLFFNCAEQGQTSSSIPWKSEARRHGEFDLRLQMAKAAVQWNDGRHLMALDCMDQLKPAIRESPMPLKRQFWFNYAILAAESMLPSRCEGAMLSLREAIPPKILQSWEGNLRLCSIWHEISLGHPAEAVRMLSGLSSEVENEWKLATLYREETTAMAYSCLGDRFRAMEHWKHACRLRPNVPLNKRRRALRSRILAMA